MAQVELIRDVTPEEVEWLERTYKKGERLWVFTGPTYGSITPNGTALTEQEDENPFLEFPNDSFVLVAGPLGARVPRSQAEEPKPDPKPEIIRTLTLEARDYFGETGDDIVVTKLNLMSDHTVRWESTNLGGW